MRCTLMIFAFSTIALGCTGCGLFKGDDPDTGPGGVGATCDAPTDCRASLDCLAGSCQPGGTQLEGAPCELTGDCADGLYCNPSRVCAPAGDASEGEPCTSTADCEPGWVCHLEGFSLSCVEPGDGDLGQSCASDVDCLAGLSCGDGLDGPTCQSIDFDTDVLPPAPTTWSGATCPADDGAPEALFDVPRGAPSSDDFFALPFPNDVRRTDTGLDLTGFPTPATALDTDIMGRYVEAAEEDLTAFGTNPVVFFRFTEPYTSVSGATVKMVNLDDPGAGSPGLSWLTTSGRMSNYTCPNILGVTPRRTLAPDTTYAVLVFDDVTPAEGGTFERSSDLTALLSDTEPSDPDLTPHHAKYDALRAHLADQDIDPATVLNATVFTTQTPEAMAPRLHDVIRAGEPPELTDLTVCDTDVVSPCDDGTPERGCEAAHPDFTEIHGRISLPIFQAGEPPYFEPADGGAIETDGSGDPVVARTEPVCFAMTIPEGATPPAAGWPVAVYAHGTGGSFRSAVLNGVAADLATGAPPVATFAIDLPQHGERRGDSTRPPEELFFNFANPRTARDNVLQGAADLMAVNYAAQNVDTAASGSWPTADPVLFDPSRVSVFAHSQGATHASLALPHEPGYVGAVLSGNGGYLTRSLLTKTEPVNVQAILPIALLDANDDGGLALGSSNPALALWQMYLEPSDPLNHGRSLRDDPGRHVFMTYGPGDSYSTEPTMQAYARRARLVPVQPVLADISGLPPSEPPPLVGNLTAGGMQWTYGLRQYEPPMDVDGHFVATRNDEARADVLRFLRAVADGDAPPIGE
ncbi:MAG: hypothetical protein ACOCV4_00340 [Myxococcota bacterium]